MLQARTEYHASYPPTDAKSAYVAKILGRADGSRKYERGFSSDNITLLEGDEGLYEVQHALKKGGYCREYFVILSDPKYGLIKSLDCEAIVSKLVKLLDEGVDIHAAVEVTGLRPSRKTLGLWVFEAVARSLVKARKQVTATTLQQAVATCHETLQQLPQQEQQKAMTALRKLFRGGA